MKLERFTNYWNEKTDGTNAGATATHAAATAERHHILWATFYTDADSILQIKDGTTVVWETKIDVSVEGFTRHITFPEGCLVGTRGNAVSAVVASSTADCAVQLGGYSLA